MAESIPVALEPPVAVALAKLIKAFPGPGALPGGVWMEPKWDGFIHWTLSSGVLVPFSSKRAPALRGTRTSDSICGSDLG